MKIIDMKKQKDLMNTLRFLRGVTAEEDSDPTPPPPKKQDNHSMYERFLKKYDNLEDYIDTFKTRDLCYYFKKVSEDAGYKYVISNIKKDMHIFKVLQESYNIREICGMIEFLFNSEQDYLEKERLSPNLLASRWINTIYADFELWVEDKYTPKSKKKHSNKEWTAPIEESNTKIGEWE